MQFQDAQPVSDMYMYDQWDVYDVQVYWEVP